MHIYIQYKISHLTLYNNTVYRVLFAQVKKCNKNRENSIHHFIRNLCILFLQYCRKRKLSQTLDTETQRNTIQRAIGFKLCVIVII